MSIFLVTSAENRPRNSGCEEGLDFSHNQTRILSNRPSREPTELPTYFEDQILPLEVIGQPGTSGMGAEPIISTAFSGVARPSENYDPAGRGDDYVLAMRFFYAGQPEMAESWFLPGSRGPSLHHVRVGAPIKGC